jgi:hypothetical protein
LASSRTTPNSPASKFRLPATSDPRRWVACYFRAAGGGPLKFLGLHRLFGCEKSFEFGMATL